MSGTLGIIRFFVGRGWRTGQSCFIMTAVKLRDDVVDFHVPRPNASNLSGHVRRDEDPVLDVFRLLDSPENLASTGLRSFLYRGLEVPLLVATQPGRSHATENEITHDCLQHGERPLHAVIDVPEQSGTQLDRERLAGVGDGLPRPDPGGLLVHLDDRLLAEDLDDLSHQLLRPHEHDVVHARLHADGRHDRPGDALDRAGSLDFRRHLRARRHVAHLT